LIAIDFVPVSLKQKPPDQTDAEPDGFKPENGGYSRGDAEFAEKFNKLRQLRYLILLRVLRVSAGK